MKRMLLATSIFLGLVFTTDLVNAQSRGYTPSSRATFSTIKNILIEDAIPIYRTNATSLQATFIGENNGSVIIDMSYPYGNYNWGVFPSATGSPSIIRELDKKTGTLSISYYLNDYYWGTIEYSQRDGAPYWYNVRDMWYDLADAIQSNKNHPAYQDQKVITDELYRFWKTIPSS